jgi:hypothetical protein
MQIFLLLSNHSIQVAFEAGIFRSYILCGLVRLLYNGGLRKLFMMWMLFLHFYHSLFESKRIFTSQTTYYYFTAPKPQLIFQWHKYDPAPAIPPLLNSYRIIYEWRAISLHTCNSSDLSRIICRSPSGLRIRFNRSAQYGNILTRKAKSLAFQKKLVGSSVVLG